MAKAKVKAEVGVKAGVGGQVHLPVVMGHLNKLPDRVMAHLPQDLHPLQGTLD